MPARFVISVNVTGDFACGDGGGGFVVGVSELYDLPVRCGVGVGLGAPFCAMAAWRLRQNPMTSKKKSRDPKLHTKDDRTVASGLR